MGLLWWDGITWDTPLRDIGWAYLFMILLGGVMTRLIHGFFRDLRK